MSEIIHGRTGTYTRHGCRCSECRAAWNSYMRGWRARNPGYSQRETQRRRAVKAAAK